MDDLLADEPDAEGMEGNTDFIQHCFEQHVPDVAYHYYVSRIMLFSFMERHAEVLEFNDTHLDLHNYNDAQFGQLLWIIFCALSDYRKARKPARAAGSDDFKPFLRAQWDRTLVGIRDSATWHPANFLHYTKLLEAESMPRKPEAIGPILDLYEQAAQAAKHQDLHHIQAFIHQSQARFWQECAKPDMAAMYRNRAVEDWKQGGAAHLLEPDG